MGINCADYDWTASLLCIQQQLVAGQQASELKSSSAAAAGGPLLLTTCNSIEEIDQEAPTLDEEWGISALGIGSANPYRSYRMVQSGTIANDVYARNASTCVYGPPGDNELQHEEEDTMLDEFESDQAYL